MHLENFWLKQIQNGRLSATIYFHIADIWETVLDTCTWTITIKQNVRFQERMHLENFRLEQIQNGRLSVIIHFNMVVIWQTLLDG